MNVVSGSLKTARFLKVALVIVAISVSARRALAQTCGSVPTGMACVAAGASVDITASVDGVCAKITNNHASGKAVMVPMRTTTEWSGFRSKSPSGVSIGLCGVPAAPQYFVFTTSQTWTPPAGFETSKALLECVGGGGASSGAGGGGGAYDSWKQTLFNVVADTLTITVGSGGGADISGGQSSIDINDGLGGSLQAVMASGGSRGNGTQGGLGGAANPSSGNLSYSGGNGGYADSAVTGSSGGGSAALPTATGFDGGAAGPKGGGGGGGVGAAASNGLLAAGSPGGTGTSPGTGGTAGASQSGGNGSMGGGGGGGARGSLYYAGNAGFSRLMAGGSIGPGGGGGGAGEGNDDSTDGRAGGDGSNGGGGGGSRVAPPGRGGNGFCVITWTP